MAKPTSAPTRSRISPAKRSAAYHEAAHTVAAYALGIPTDEVWMWNLPVHTIRGQGGIAGQHTPNRDWMRDHIGMGAPEDNDDKLFLSLAPGPAERRLAIERGWRDPGPDHFCSDFIEIVDKLMEKEPPGSEHLSDASIDRLRVARERAQRFIDDDTNWRAIEAVAAALLAHIARDEFARLDGLDIYPLIRAARGESEPSAAEQWLVEHRAERQRAIQRAKKPRRSV
jgi:hypothetical protein